MPEDQKKWIYLMLGFILGGYVVGALVKFIIKHILVAEVFAGLISLIIPFFMVVAIFIFLYVYHKNQLK